MSQWSNEYAVLRDLSIAQRIVPVGVEGILRAGDTPPALNIVEETEAEFFDDCTNEDDVKQPPDYNLIREMLNMVRDSNVTSDDEDFTEKVGVISKLNPECAPFIPRNVKPNPAPKTNAIPKKLKRNIALESILQNISQNNERESSNAKNDNYSTNTKLLLLKPDHFIHELEKKTGNVHDKTEIVKVPIKNDTALIPKVQKENNTAFTPKVQIENNSAFIPKVQGWLQQTQAVEKLVTFQRKPPRAISLDTNNMFKRKTIVKDVDQQLNNGKCQQLNNGTCERPKQNNGVFVPSSLANEYYKKYVERNNLSNSVKDDIWTLAEKKMKEIETRKQVPSDNPSPDKSSSPDVNLICEQEHNDDHPPEYLSLPRWAELRLPRPRHMLTGDCVMCSVLTRNDHTNRNNDTIDNNDGGNSDGVEINDTVQNRDTIEINDTVQNRDTIEINDTVQNRDIVEINDTVQNSDTVDNNDVVHSDTIVINDKVQNRDAVKINDTVRIRDVEINDTVQNKDTVEMKDEVQNKDTVQTNDTFQNSDTVTNDNIQNKYTIVIKDNNVQNKDTIVISENISNSDTIENNEIFQNIDTIAISDNIQNSDTIEINSDISNSVIIDSDVATTQNRDNNDNVHNNVIINEDIDDSGIIKIDDEIRNSDIIKIDQNNSDTIVDVSKCNLSIDEGIPVGDLLGIF